MVAYKSFNTIILEMIQQLQLSQPSLDIKPGSVARDLFIDAPAQQISNLYDLLRQVATLQSISNVTGQDLTNYGSNFGVSRNSGTKSSGTAVLCFRSLENDIPVSAGSVVRSRNGIPFLTISTMTIAASQINAYRANALRMRQQLNTAGITDEFAVEVSVEAQSPGSVANIGSYTIVSHSIPGITGVTNVAPMSGGTDLENDAAFRSRILATFAGANVGTSLGYRSLVLGLASAVDALVVEPGDTLMLRDGTVVVTQADGTIAVSEPGTGGKVDIYVMGTNAQSATDSFLYQDASGRNDPTASANYYILGQSSLTPATSLTINSRRVSVLTDGASMPTQPVSKIVSVSGSSSGPNFIEQYLDSVGNLQGNYKLISDTGIAGGSPFGLDKLAWTSNKISLTGENITKGSANSVDGLAFTEALEITGVSQDIQVVNENPIISSDRSHIVARHTPVKTVSRVFNLTTGERYVISDQNPDGTTSINYTGRVAITGRTLPAPSDILQVDYIWLYSFDGNTDYDNLVPQDALNTAQDSINWGVSNFIRDEVGTAILDSYGNLKANTTYNVNKILTINTYTDVSLTVGGSPSQKTLTTTSSITNIHSIKKSTGEEVYNTYLADGSFSYMLITLPTDTLAEVGDVVTLTYNLSDVSAIDGYLAATSVNNVITLNPNSAVVTGTPVLINYVMDYFNVVPSSNVAALPVSGNGYNSFTTVGGFQPILNQFVGTSVLANKRRAPSNLVLSVSNIPTSGTIKIIGTTLNKVDAVLTATVDSINLTALIKNNEGLSSSATLPSSIYVARVVSVEAVTPYITGEIQTTDFTYDLTNYQIYDSRWDKAHAITNSGLAKTAVQLQDTSTNISAPIITGTHLRVVFYYAKTNDYEDVFFSRNGSMITNKRFGYVSSINRASGFQDSSGTTSGKIIIDSFNQPLTNSIYSTDYDYTSPKENERITINYEYNKLIVDATEAIEAKRPVTADVLVKAASKIELDVTAKIVVLPAFKDKKETVRQDVMDNITSTLSATALNTTLDSSDIVNGAYNVAGLDRITITRFNKTNVSGTKISISADKDEYLAPGTIEVTTEDR